MASSRETRVAARRRLIMLRHGQTLYNATSHIQGRLDTQLSDVGREQTHTAVQYPTEAEPRIMEIASSDLTQVADTAHVLAKITGAELGFDKRLRETDLGEWQERIYGKIDSTFPGIRDHWCHNLNWAPKGGEIRFEAFNRMLAVTVGLATNLDRESDTFVLMSHDGTITTVTAALLQMPCSYFSTSSGPGNTAQVEMEQRTRASGEISRCLNTFNAKIREWEPQVSDSSGGRHVR